MLNYKQVAGGLNPGKRYRYSGECDICGLKDCVVYYDTQTKQGPWANTCERCWKTHSKTGKLGVGKGQKYVTEAAGEC